MSGIPENNLDFVLSLSSTGTMRVVVGGVSKNILKENLNWEIEQIIGLSDTLAGKASISYVDNKLISQYPIVTVTNYSTLLTLQNKTEDTLYILLNEETIDSTVYPKYSKWMYSLANNDFFSVDSLLQPKCPVDGNIYVGKNGSWARTYSIIPHDYDLTPSMQESDYSIQLNHQIGFSPIHIYSDDVYFINTMQNPAGSSIMQKANVTVQHIVNPSGVCNGTIIYFSEPIPNKAIIKILEIK